MIRYYLTISGEVQGVGFRYFAYHTAKNYQITGWVKNDFYTDHVLMEVQGDKEEIERYILHLRKGNGYSYISNITRQQLPVKDEKSFEVAFF